MCSDSLAVAGYNVLLLDVTSGVYKRRQVDSCVIGSMSSLLTVACYYWDHSGSAWLCKNFTIYSSGLTKSLSIIFQFKTLTASLEKLSVRNRLRNRMLVFYRYRNSNSIESPHPILS